MLPYVIYVCVTLSITIKSNITQSKVCGIIIYVEYMNLYMNPTVIFVGPSRCVRL